MCVCPLFVSSKEKINTNFFVFFVSPPFFVDGYCFCFCFCRVFIISFCLCICMGQKNENAKAVWLFYLCRHSHDEFLFILIDFLFWIEFTFFFLLTFFLTGTCCVCASFFFVLTVCVLIVSITWLSALLFSCYHNSYLHLDMRLFLFLCDVYVCAHACILLFCPPIDHIIFVFL